jgi:hypothetical protein
MTNENDRFTEALRNAARDYNKPPELSRAELEQMWTAIEVEAFPRRFASPSAEHPVASSRGVRSARWLAVRNVLPLAAVLLLGVAIGRASAPRPSPATPMPDVAMRRAAVDTVSLPEPYQSTTSRYLGQTAALLVALPAEVRSGGANDRFLGRAHDLLLTTRLLLDSPAAADPRFRTLLEDLELVLAQVVRLHTDQGRADLDLIRQALEQRDVLPRLRTAVADISAD